MRNALADRETRTPITRAEQMFRMSGQNPRSGRNACHLSSEERNVLPAHTEGVLPTAVYIQQLRNRLDKQYWRNEEYVCESIKTGVNCMRKIFLFITLLRSYGCFNNSWIFQTMHVPDSSYPGGPSSSISILIATW